MSAPYDPRAAALDALAAMRWPDVSEPPVEQVEAVANYLALVYALSEARTRCERLRCAPPPVYTVFASIAGREGRPLVPPA